MAAPELIGYDATGRKTEVAVGCETVERKSFRRTPAPFSSWTPGAK